jgi:hypothetical protein
MLINVTYFQFAWHHQIDGRWCCKDMKQPVKIAVSLCHTFDSGGELSHHSAANDITVRERVPILLCNLLQLGQQLLCSFSIPGCPFLLDALSACCIVLDSPARHLMQR